MYGQYQVFERIAEGGMAEIYRGLARGVEGFERPVVIKKVHARYSSDARYVDLLIREAKITARLHHRNIVQILDLGQNDDGEYFIVMEFVDGRDLRTAMDHAARMRQPLSQDMALYIATEVCDALHHAHRLADAQGRTLNLIHRDVSPSNILISYAGEVKLTDFGVARYGRDVSQVGSLKGKVAYMSPEQARGKGVDHRSDIFSLGAVLFELVVGRRVFQASTELEMLQAVRSAKIPLPSSIAPGIAPELEGILLRALEPEAARRYQAVADLGAALRAYRMRSATTLVGPTDLASLLVRLFGASQASLPTVSQVAFALNTVAGFDLPRTANLRSADPGRRLNDAVTNPGIPSPTLLARLRGAEHERGKGGGKGGEGHALARELGAGKRPGGLASVPTVPNRHSVVEVTDEDVVDEEHLRAAPGEASVATVATADPVRHAAEVLDRMDDEDEPTEMRGPQHSGGPLGAYRPPSVPVDLELVKQMTGMPPLPEDITAETDLPDHLRDELPPFETDELAMIPPLPPDAAEEPPTTSDAGIVWPSSPSVDTEDASTPAATPAGPVGESALRILPPRAATKPLPLPDEAVPLPMSAAAPVATPFVQPMRTSSEAVPRRGLRAWLVVAPLGLAVGTLGAYALVHRLLEGDARTRLVTSVQQPGAVAEEPDAAPPAVTQALGPTKALGPAKAPAPDAAAAAPDVAAARASAPPREEADARSGGPSASPATRRGRPSGKGTLLAENGSAPATGAPAVPTRTAPTRPSTEGAVVALKSAPRKRPGARRPIAAVRPIAAARPSRGSTLPRPAKPEAVDPGGAEPKPAGAGRVILKSEPWAYIVVDGKETGRTTSATPFSLPAGTHEVELVNPALKLRKRVSIHVEPGETVRRFVTLQ
ncbi:MAG: protein kinase [Deltaproteobacteria bacterium]|nr:protein kinase [Deltaproteobacteria bacterium]